jgi:hydrogenase maturation protein HypF
MKRNDRGPAGAPAAGRQRLAIEIRGAVQGVGFRPFVFRLASSLALDGWVRNDSRGVSIEVEGDPSLLESFLERLPAEAPAISIIQDLEARWLEAAGHAGFRIDHTDAGGAKTVLVLPDVATCPQCLSEMNTPGDRRFRYPFTNCTNCGPRFSIIEALPYDRPNTTMRSFVMCELCRAEYEEPGNRRFHAQPNACPQCGPQLTLLSTEGALLAAADEALERAARALAAGKILALKGLGGFHLMVDARDEEAVALLRQRKARPGKPLALMVGTLEQARQLGEVSENGAQAMLAAQAPIVLLRRSELSRSLVADDIAPDTETLGVMLPYTPLHHLLFREVDFPLVATSGNLSDEPICIDNDEAIERLGGIADLFLVHDRPITRHVDDSVVWLVEDAPQPLRRARGMAPLPVLLASPAPTILAVGAHLKNAVALSVDDNVFISQHIGDMETVEAVDAFERVIEDFLALYEAEPVAIAHDLHPGYMTTQWARRVTSGGRGREPRGRGDNRTSGLPDMPGRSGDSGGPRFQQLAGLPLIPVQHHHAHLASCLAEHGVEGKALAVSWDGTGFGTDGTVWGGEFLLGDTCDYDRVAHLRPFRLAGAEAAVHEPRRVALALLWEIFGDTAFEQGTVALNRSFSEPERRVLSRLLESGFRAPFTTSAGRLFDGVAALIGLHPKVSYEAQAAMALERIADTAVQDAYPMPLSDGHAEAGSTEMLDWRPLVEAVLEDCRRRVDAGIIAGRFLNALVESIVAVARGCQPPRVVLTGGCFQNRWLVERTAARLRGEGFAVLLHRRVPPNDGGISLGQVAVAAARLRAEGQE